MNMCTDATLRTSRVLLTGPPGIGKTTICNKLTSMMKEENYKFDGFCTKEVLGPNGRRIGFDIELVNKPEEKLTLARIKDVLNKSQQSKYKVGNYHVFLRNFETVALPIFDSNADILLIDEIGKMELLSQKFHDKVVKLFSETSNKPFVISTIPQIHKVPERHLPLFKELHADKKSKLIYVNHKNRDSLPEEIFHLISSHKV